MEDDTDLNRTLCPFLRQNGYEATGCLLANDAYNAMYGTLFDLIISDAMMPQIDGLAFAQTVREFNLLYKLLSYPKRRSRACS